MFNRTLCYRVGLASKAQNNDCQAAMPDMIATLRTDEAIVFGAATHD
jgi:hypothetical protein